MENPDIISFDILVNEPFIIIDDSLWISPFIESSLKHIMNINGLNFDDLDYRFVKASSPSSLVLKAVKYFDNLIISTSFTSIKNTYFEDLLNVALDNGIKNKKIFSIMQFDIVGDSFMDHIDQVRLLADNNVHFYFRSDNDRTFKKFDK